MAFYYPRLAPVPTSELYQSLRSLQSRWPRIASSGAPVHDIIGDIAERRFGPARSTEVSEVETASGKELAESLERLLANTYAKEYPLTEETLDPLGSPGHYLKVKTVMESADRMVEQSERRSRSWFSFLRRS